MRCKGTLFLPLHKFFSAFLATKITIVSIFAKGEMTWTMRKIMKQCGLTVLILGILLLVVGFFTHFCDHNIYLALCAVLIISGLVKYVIEQKHRGNY